MEEQKSFSQRVKETVIQCAYSYKHYYVEYEYLLCSQAFEKNEYYIVSAHEDNYLHLTGLHTNLDATSFFEKCYGGTLEETDFDFCKRGQNESEVKGSVRRKISALENINNFFAQNLYIEEGFRKNKVSCVIATSDNKITIGFSDGMYSRPKTLLKGNMLNMSTNQIDLILSKEKKDKTFNKIEYGNEEILSYYHKDIYHLISKNLI